MGGGPLVGEVEIFLHATSAASRSVDRFESTSELSMWERETLLVEADCWGFSNQPHYSVGYSNELAGYFPSGLDDSSPYLWKDQLRPI